jgi:uncharacterized protein (DUF302 family)
MRTYSECARQVIQVEVILASFVGPLDFALFQRIDRGAIVTALTGRNRDATTYVFGNALIAIEMIKHVPRAGLYVPLRLFVEAIDTDGVRITYDLPSSLMAQFGSAEVDEVALCLDEKVRRLLDEASKVAGPPARGDRTPARARARPGDRCRFHGGHCRRGWATVLCQIATTG